MISRLASFTTAFTGVLIRKTTYFLGGLRHDLARIAKLSVFISQNNVACLVLTT